MGQAQHVLTPDLQRESFCSVKFQGKRGEAWKHRKSVDYVGNIM